MERIYTVGVLILSEYLNDLVVFERKTFRLIAWTGHLSALFIRKKFVADALAKDF